jgi:hypothetical protein
MVEVGGGIWLEIGADAGLLIAGTAEIPFGDDISTPLVILAHAGIDF